MEERPMARRPRPASSTRMVGDEEAAAALLDVATHLRDARKAIARLMLMENARPPDIHADDDHIRKVIRSVETKRRNLARASAGKAVERPDAV